MAQTIPKLLFVGAGNIAQSIIKGILKARPNASNCILATAPSSRNLERVRTNYHCLTYLLENAHKYVAEFEPDFVFLCFKPQVFIRSLENNDDEVKDSLKEFMKIIPSHCMTLSLLAGVGTNDIALTYKLPKQNVVRVMLNTAAEIGSSSVLYYANPGFNNYRKSQEMEGLLKLVGNAVVKLNDEELMDVATGICGSGIAFFYEMIQTISDTAVKNGISRTDATMIAAQLSRAAGEMLLEKQLHPYQLRDDVTSPAGTTIYGISSWHENSTSQSINKAFQESINRARTLSDMTRQKINRILNLRQ